MPSMRPSPHSATGGGGAEQVQLGVLQVEPVPRAIWQIRSAAAAAVGFEVPGSQTSAGRPPIASSRCPSPQTGAGLQLQVDVLQVEPIPASAVQIACAAAAAGPAGFVPASHCSLGRLPIASFRTPSPQIGAGLHWQEVELQVDPAPPNLSQMAKAEAA